MLDPAPQGKEDGQHISSSLNINQAADFIPTYDGSFQLQDLFQEALEAKRQVGRTR